MDYTEWKGSVVVFAVKSQVDWRILPETTQARSRNDQIGPLFHTDGGQRKIPGVDWAHKQIGSDSHMPEGCKSELEDIGHAAIVVVDCSPARNAEGCTLTWAPDRMIAVETEYSFRKQLPSVVRCRHLSIGSEAVAPTQQVRSVHHMAEQDMGSCWRILRYSTVGFDC